VGVEVDLKAVTQGAVMSNDLRFATTTSCSFRSHPIFIAADFMQAVDHHHVPSTRFQGLADRQPLRYLRVLPRPHAGAGSLMQTRLDSRQETSVRDFLDVVFRRKWVILGIVFAATLLVVILDAQRPDAWESTSRVLIRRGEQRTILNPAQMSILPWAEDVASVIQVILSQDVFAHAKVAFADSVRAHNLPKDWTFNPGSVHAAVIGESNVFTISYDDTRPEVCPLGCNVVTEAFQRFYAQHYAPPPVSDYFANELQSTNAQLEQERQRRNTYMNDTKFFGTEETSRFLLNKISALELTVSSLNGDVDSQELRVANLEKLAQKERSRAGERARFLGVAARAAVRNRPGYQDRAPTAQHEERRAGPEVHRQTPGCRRGQRADQAAP
jgi:hypothetical protein